MFRRTKKSAPRRGSLSRNFRPVGESLESRLNLAGGVVAYALGSSLYVYGDALANNLRIEGDGVGRVEIQGVATAVNGTPNGQLNATGIQNIFMDLGNGDDTATFVLTNISGALRFTGGNGNDDLVFGEGNNGSNRFGSLQAIMGSGNDDVNVEDNEDNFRVSGAFTALMGDGSNTVSLDPLVSLVLGATSVTGGANDDFFGIGLAQVQTGFITFSGGNGTNNFYLDGEVTVNGGISVLGGTGIDNFEPGFDNNQLTVNGSIVASLGNGTNTVHFRHDNVDVTGLISVIGGTGIDTFDIDSQTFDALAVSLSLLAGNNQVRMDSGATTIRSNLTITTLGGLDSITGFGLNVVGATTVNTGDGADLIQLDNSRFRSVVTVLTGGGDDRVNVENGNENDGIGTRFDSIVNIDLGLGNDTLDIGIDANDFVTFAGRTIANGSLGTDTLLPSPFNVFAVAPTLISFP